MEIRGIGVQIRSRYLDVPYHVLNGLYVCCSGPGDKYVKVTEVMGECRFSFTLPMQLL